MTKFLTFAAALLLSSTPALAAPAEPTAPAVPSAPARPAAPAGALPGIEQQVRCSIVFALVAQQQAGQVPGANRFAPMAGPGKAFFVTTGLRVIELQVVPQAALQAYYAARVAKVRADLAAASNPAAALDREMARCLPLLASAPVRPGIQVKPAALITQR